MARLLWRDTTTGRLLVDNQGRPLFTQDCPCGCAECAACLDGVVPASLLVTISGVTNGSCAGCVQEENLSIVVPFFGSIPRGLADSMICRWDSNPTGAAMQQTNCYVNSPLFPDGSAPSHRRVVVDIGFMANTANGNITDGPGIVILQTDGIRVGYGRCCGHNGEDFTDVAYWQMPIPGPKDCFAVRMLSGRNYLGNICDRSASVVTVQPAP